MDDLVEKYVVLRDKKAEISAEYKAKIAKVDEILGRIEGALLSQFGQLGVESVRTKSGTAYMSHRTAATVADWDTTLEYIRNTDNWQLLERRVSKKDVEEFKGEHGDLPPGVNWRDEVVVNVRRS